MPDWRILLCQRIRADRRKVAGEIVRALTVAKGDSPLGEVVPRQLQGDAVAGKDADAVAAQPAGQVREHDTVMFQLNAEQTARKFFQDNSGDFDIVFFTHSTFLYQSRAPLRPGKPAIRDEGWPVCRALSQSFCQ